MPTNTPYQFLFRSDIQGLRGLAVLLVVLFHLETGLTGGFVGVDVFFVISGFVISGGIFRELDSEAGLRVRNFFKRRIRRLLPTLSFVLTTSILAGIIFGPEISQRVSGRTALAATYLNANNYLYRAGGYFQPKAEENFFLHTWSLSVEEQFYLVFPFLLLIGWKLRNSLVGARLALALLFLVSFATCLFFTYWETPLLDASRAAFYASPLRAWEFAIGGLLAAFLPQLQRVQASPVTSPFWESVGWLGLFMILASSVLFDGSDAFPGYIALVPTVGTGLLILGGVNGRLEKLMSHPALTRLGDLSYSWYLWHWPLIVFAKATFPNNYSGVIVSGVVSLWLAWLTERYIEKPFRHSDSKINVFALILILLGAPTLAWLIQVKLPPLHHQIVQLRQMNHDYVALGCDSALPYDQHSTKCRWGDPTSPKVVLLGDSNARQHIPAIKELALESGRQIQVATYSSCPFILGVTPVEKGVEKKSCREWVEQSIENVLKERPSLVIVSSAMDSYLQTPHWRFHNERGEVRNPVDDLRQTTEKLLERDINLVYIAPIPKLYSANGEATTRFGRGCSLAAIALTPAECTSTWTLPSDGLQFDPAVYKTNSLDQAAVIDLAVDICPKDTCTVYDGTDWLYHDAGHLSVYGSTKTKKALKERLKL